MASQTRESMKYKVVAQTEDDPTTSAENDAKRD
jgi:hypothetical protein